MMVSDPAYRAGLDIQVNGMLRLARRKSRSFGKDCLSNPGMLRQHWTKQLDIIYYSPREQDQIKTIREDGRTVDDNASFADLLGFFSPASHPEAELDKAYVAWDEGSFTTRRNFTLLHEIGHYLQETDFELMKRICSFEKRLRRQEVRGGCVQPVRVAGAPAGQIHLEMACPRPFPMCQGHSCCLRARKGVLG